MSHRSMIDLRDAGKSIYFPRSLCRAESTWERRAVAALVVATPVAMAAFLLYVAASLFV